jgi:hypothetical protein
MAMDLAAAGAKVVAGAGGGTSPSDALTQSVSLAPNSDTPLGYQRLAALGTAQSLTVPTGALWAIIRVEAEDVRWRDDGTAPSSTIGMPLAAGETMVYRAALAAIQFIQQTSGAILNVVYYK